MNASPKRNKSVGLQARGTVLIAVLLVCLVVGLLMTGGVKLIAAQSESSSTGSVSIQKAGSDLYVIPIEQNQRLQRSVVMSPKPESVEANRISGFMGVQSAHGRGGVIQREQTSGIIDEVKERGGGARQQIVSESDALQEQAILKSQGRAFSVRRTETPDNREILSLQEKLDR